MRSRASRHCSRRAIFCTSILFLILVYRATGCRCQANDRSCYAYAWAAAHCYEEQMKLHCCTISAGVARPCTCIGIMLARRSLVKQLSASAISVGRRGCLPWSPILLLKSLNCKQKPGSFAFLKNMRSYNCAFHMALSGEVFLHICSSCQYTFVCRCKRGYSIMCS